MKMWLKRDEWMLYASCQGDTRFIAEAPTEDSKLRLVCDMCRVRPECSSWATREEASSVFVVGVRLPDPAFKKELKAAHNNLRANLSNEYQARGEDI